MTAPMDGPRTDTWSIGERTFSSRLLVGTGRFKDADETKQALRASGAEIVTVALRRIGTLSGPTGSEQSGRSLLDSLDQEFRLLPNTAGCYTVDDAVRTCHLARELGIADLVKLEVIGDEKTLFPDNAATVEAAKILVGDGFTVLPYCGDDVVTCKKLVDAGCPAVMPLAAPIGSGLGIQNPHNLRLILDAVDVPVIVDAGVGTASDAARAMELGVTAVLMNTGIAAAEQPVLMANAMREAVSAGRQAFLAGRMAKKAYATASSPLTGTIG